MSNILLIPLNTNHVLILYEIMKNIQSRSVMLCYDNIAGGKNYHTGSLLKEKEIPYITFEKKINRTEHGNFFEETINFFRIRRIVSALLEKIKPKVVVLAVDNDPISYAVLKAAKKRGIKSVIVQEGSARPDAKRKIRSLRMFVYEIIRLFGIRLSYILHGTSNLYDKYLVAGMSAKEAFISRGLEEKKFEVTGQPKYDNFITEAQDYRNKNLTGNTLLFAAGFYIVSDTRNIQFLKDLVKLTAIKNIKLTIKLHPRSTINVEDIKQKLIGDDIDHCTIIKCGDDTLDLLKKSYGLITVSSTVITEALILNREGIIINYLAGDMKLPFEGYDAVHHINQRERNRI